MSACKCSNKDGLSCSPARPMSCDHTSGPLIHVDTTLGNQHYGGWPSHKIACRCSHPLTCCLAVRCMHCRRDRTYSTNEHHLFALHCAQRRGYRRDGENEESRIQIEYRYRLAAYKVSLGTTQANSTWLAPSFGNLVAAQRLQSEEFVRSRPLRIFFIDR